MNEQLKRKFEKIRAAEDEANFRATLTRARAVTVGTAFGGTTELCMRAADGSVLWTPMQPVETVELIHQLAASIGCHIAIKPRNDFASWRHWRDIPGVEGGMIATDMDHAMQVGANMGSPDKLPGRQPAMMARSESNEQTVATQKTVGRKRTKRAAAAA